jgi:hypothetical protein
MAENPDEVNVDLHLREPILEKHKAGYEPTSSRNRGCRFCAAFTWGEHPVADGSCTLVRGRVNPYGGCRFFDRRTVRADVGRYVLQPDGRHLRIKE